MKELEVHPIAEQFPLMPAEEMIELIKDIKEHGLRNPIMLFQNKILDGRHRYEACQQAKVNPKFSRYTGHDPFGFCVSQNIHRRHLTTGQRAMIGAKVADLKRGGDRKSPGFQNRSASFRSGEPEGKSPDSQDQSAGFRSGETAAVRSAAAIPTHAQAAEHLQVSARSIDSASSILDEDPELAVEVANGNITLHAAEARIKARKAKPAAPKDNVERDETGWPIPEECMELWNRRNEITEPMGMLKKLEKHLKERQAENDPLYRPINFSAAIMDIQRVHMDIRAARLYAVCPTCHGKLPEDCNICKKRGFVNHVFWETGIPIEVKQLRQNIIDGKKSKRVHHLKDNVEHPEAIVPKWNESPLFSFLARHYPDRLAQATD